MLHAGAVLLTASDGPSVNGLFLMFVIVQAIYGVGVGGEYPVVCPPASPICSSNNKAAAREECSGYEYDCLTLNSS